MKPLIELSKIERATLLHQLFPYVIPAFIAYLQESIKKILADPNAFRNNWDCEAMPAQQWYEVAVVAKLHVFECYEELKKDANFFAERLFAEEIIPFTIPLLSEFAAACPNHSFYLAAELLFDV